MTELELLILLKYGQEEQIEDVFGKISALFKKMKTWDQEWSDELLDIANCPIVFEKRADLARELLMQLSKKVTNHKERARLFCNSKCAGKWKITCALPIKHTGECGCIRKKDVHTWQW